MASGGTLAVAAAAGYLLGSVNFALLIARARGVDLRAFGSGNLGATNAGRAMGRPVGVAVYVLDALKGFLPAFLVPRMLAPDRGPWDLDHLISGSATEAEVLLGTVAGAAAVAGHIWPCWLRFKGGKGVATLSGALLALHPWTLGAAAIAHGAVVSTTRLMALASLAFGLTLPIAALLLGAPTPVVLFAVAAAALLFFTHRSNLRRMLRGEEDRLGSPLEKDS